LSAYQLTIELNTVFFSKPPRLPEHDLCADMQAEIEEVLDQNKFEHYETSAFARPGHRCKHNLNYWEFGDYLGIGAGAHGKISFPDRITRHEWAKQPASYMKEASVQNREIQPRELAFEFMLNALRLPYGFSNSLFQERTGLPFTAISGPLQVAEEKGLIERDLKHVRPTLKGQRFLNELLQLFLAA
jgi:oxygen-independent coproporphyrinogen-3 oxidase